MQVTLTEDCARTLILAVKLLSQLEPVQRRTYWQTLANGTRGNERSKMLAAGESSCFDDDFDFTRLENILYDALRGYNSKIDKKPILEALAELFVDPDMNDSDITEGLAGLGRSFLRPSEYAELTQIIKNRAFACHYCKHSFSRNEVATFTLGEEGKMTIACPSCASVSRIKCSHETCNRLADYPSILRYRLHYCAEHQKAPKVVPQKAQSEKKKKSIFDADYAVLLRNVAARGLGQNQEPEPQFGGGLRFIPPAPAARWHDADLIVDGREDE